MLKHVSSKYDKNLLFSPTIEYLIDTIGEFKDFHTSLIELAEQGNVEEAMSLIKLIKPELYIKKGKWYETRLKDMVKDNQKNLN